ncbi:MAG: Ldh family oxidoreductase, partial [Candidatus Bathycorpusculaceae bacterium]
VSAVFQALQVSKDDACAVADVIVAADLAGISSHGVQRIRRYVDGIRIGNVNVKSNIRVVSESEAIALLDADNGLGQVAASKAMDLAVKKAAKCGIGLTLVRNSNHFGIAGYYSMKAVEKGLIGVTLTNSEKLVAYTNTLGRSLGTNPIAVGIPKEKPPPILFDAATSVVPVGKIELYKKLGKEIPEGWVIDEFGESLSGDSASIHEKIKENKAAILPLGGSGEELGGHKGSGLSFIVDVISGVLSGAAWGLHVGYTVGDKPSNVGHTLLAVNIESLMPKEKFFDRIEKYVQEIKSAPKHSKAERIWIPGEKSWLTMQTRMKKGIPIHRTIYDDLRELADELKVHWILD